jgi:hypothetical protein
VTKTGEAGAVTKYIRVAHSSNGTVFGTASNLLAVTFANSGGSGGTGGGNPCFTGETLFKLFGGEAVSFEKLFEQRDDYIGRAALAFDEYNKPVAGIIEDIFRHEVFEHLAVAFADGSETFVTRGHKYFTENYDYVAIGKLKPGDRVFDEKMRLVEITRIGSVEAPAGVFVYNATIREYRNYVADGKRVHNLKQVEL